MYGVRRRGGHNRHELLVDSPLPFYFSLKLAELGASLSVAKQYRLRVSKERSPSPSAMKFSINIWKFQTRSLYVEKLSRSDNKVSTRAFLRFTLDHFPYYLASAERNEVERRIHFFHFFYYYIVNYLFLRKKILLFAIRRLPTPYVWESTLNKIN